MQLPEKFLLRMQERLGKEFPAFLCSYDLPARRGLRINTLKISPEEFCRRAPFPLGETIGSDPAFRYVEGERLGADVWHNAGLFYLQEPSAAAVAQEIGECRGLRVLDLCAAPGGKATYIAAKMAGEGFLVANEIIPARAKVLSQNVERMGIGSCAVTCASPEKLAEIFPSYFDLVLVDAPCSGEGMFKKEPNALTEWSEENVLMCARRQRTILGAAKRMLAGGGRLIYSTCTFAEEEDEWQISEFLKENPDFFLVRERKLYPHEFCGEGHFFAVLNRGEGERPRGRAFPIRKDRAAEKAFFEFSESFFGKPQKGEITTLPDGRMFLVPENAPDLSAVHVVRLGVELGEWDGKHFRPAHALAMSLGTEAQRKVTLSREEATKYLRGEELSAELPDGWCVVCAEEFPLGLGKCSNGRVKNHLPKGLREIH